MATWLWFWNASYSIGASYNKMVRKWRKKFYIITTVKHAIWLVNSRAGSGYPARGIKMPSRDFRGILKMSLFHCGYFMKQLPNGFPSRIAWSMHLECCSTFGKRKSTLACGSSIFTLSESLATSLVHGSRNPARKTIRCSFIPGQVSLHTSFVACVHGMLF
jgi:hypothetical protein